MKRPTKKGGGAEHLFTSAHPFSEAKDPSFFEGIESHVRRQISKAKIHENSKCLSALSYRKENERITYSNSEFNRLAESLIKDTYLAITKKYTKQSTSIVTVTEEPVSPLCIFKSDDADCVQTFTIVHFDEIATMDKFLEESGATNSMHHIFAADTLDDVSSILNDDVITQYNRLVTKEPQLQEPSEKLAQLIKHCASTKKPICSLWFFKHVIPRVSNILHAFTLILWANESGGVSCGFFDPMYYARNTMQQRREYRSPLRAMYILMRRTAVQIGIPCSFVNLGAYCYKDPSNEHNIHCVQYRFDAEFCLMYSLYFAYQFLRSGAKVDAKSLKKSVLRTFITKPGMTADDVKFTMIFKMIMMTFIATALTILYQHPSLSRIAKNIWNIHIFIKNNMMLQCGINIFGKELDYMNNIIAKYEPQPPPVPPPAPPPPMLPSAQPLPAPVGIVQSPFATVRSPFAYVSPFEIATSSRTDIPSLSNRQPSFSEWISSKGGKKRVTRRKKPNQV